MALSQLSTTTEQRRQHLTPARCNTGIKRSHESVEIRARSLEGLNLSGKKYPTSRMLSLAIKKGEPRATRPVECSKKDWASLTPEERARRSGQQSKKLRENWVNLTPEQRAGRSAGFKRHRTRKERSAAAKKGWAKNDTPEQRAIRAKKVSKQRSVSQKKTWVALTPEQRRARLKGLEKGPAARRAKSKANRAKATHRGTQEFLNEATSDGPAIMPKKTPALHKAASEQGLPRSSGSKSTGRTDNRASSNAASHQSIFRFLDEVTPDNVASTPNMTSIRHQAPLERSPRENSGSRLQDKASGSHRNVLKFLDDMIPD